MYEAWLASNRYALVEKSHEFTLVPWRPVLDRPVSGVMKGDGINWTIGVVTPSGGGCGDIQNLV